MVELVGVAGRRPAQGHPSGVGLGGVALQPAALREHPAVRSDMGGQDVNHFAVAVASSASGPSAVSLPFSSTTRPLTQPRQLRVVVTGSHHDPTVVEDLLRAPLHHRAKFGVERLVDLVEQQHRGAGLLGHREAEPGAHAL